MVRRAAMAMVATLAACASSTPQPTSTASTTATTTSASTAPTTTGAPLPSLLLPTEPTSGGSTAANGTAMPNAKPPPKNEQPSCGNDQDCWSITCCPATDAEECVHHSLAQKCALIDMTCPKLDTHVDCVCEKGTCTGRAP